MAERFSIVLLESCGRGCFPLPVFGGFVSKPTMRTPKARSLKPIEPLEPRRYFALPWSPGYTVVSQDKAAAAFRAAGNPSIAAIL